MATAIRGSLSIVIILMLCVLPRLGFGEEPTELEEVTVHDTTIEQVADSSDLTVSATTIQMSDYSDRTMTVPEILDSVAGVRIQSLGGLDDFATVAIRGSTGEQVQIYLDGVPLNQSAGGAVNLSTLPTDLIESITIYRGQAPARFATSAIGGVIAIKTRPSTPKRRTEIHNSYGSLNTYEGTVIHSQGLGNTQFLLSFQHSRTDGDFSFLDDNGTPANMSDDQTVKRRNNESAKNHFLLKVKHPLSEQTEFAFHNNFFREDRGVPGLGNLKSDLADLSTTRNITQLDFTLKDLGLSGLTLDIVPFFSFNKSQFTDLNGDIGLGRQDNDDETYLYGGDVTTEYFLGQHQRLTLAVAYRGEQFHPENFTSIQRTGEASIRNRVSLSAEDEISLWHDRLIINPMLRLEMIFNDLSGEDPSTVGFASPDSANHFPVTGKLGSRIQIIPHLYGQANFGRAFRVPSFLELFGDRGAIVGNSDLKPEQSWNFDVGLHWADKRHRFGGSYFEHRTKNLIQFLQTSQLTAQALNLASATVRGFEIEGQATIGDREVKRRHHLALELTANYTFQWAKDTSGRTGFDGKFLPGRSRHQLHAGLSVAYRWARLFADYDFIDENFLDSFNALKVSHRSLLGVGVSLSPWSWLSAGMEVKNLLNQQIEDVVGFPVPGRLLFGKVSLMI